MDREAWGATGVCKSRTQLSMQHIGVERRWQVGIFFSLLLKDKLSCIKSFKSLFKQKLIQTRQHPGQWKLEEPAI